jgi:predicted dehydrogenase
MALVMRFLLTLILLTEALNANFPVFCEKPISLDINAVDECYNLAKQKNQILLCGTFSIFNINVTYILVVGPEQ